MKNTLYLIIGIVFAIIWKHLLRNAPISEFLKWLVGIIMIILVFMVINKIMVLKNNDHAE